MRFSSQKFLGIVKRSLTPDRPYHAQWLLTRRCNYRCRGCNVWRQRPCEKELSTENVKKGLDVLRDLGVIEIVLSGGNPMLRDDIGEIIDYSSRYFVTTIYDNGSMALKRLDAVKNADFVAISLDTLDEKKFDYIKGVPGAWKKAMKSIDILSEEGIHVGVSPTISQLNLHEIINFTHHFTERGIPVWYCLYSYDSATEKPLFGIGKKANEFEIKDKKTMANVCDKLIQLKKDRQGVYITTQTLTALKHLFLRNKRTWKCKALDSFLMVDSLGRVAGCHINQPVASIWELPKIWYSQKLDKLRSEYHECKQCSYLCYIFYSIHSDVRSNLSIVFDQWKNVKTLANKTLKSIA